MLVNLFLFAASQSLLNLGLAVKATRATRICIFALICVANIWSLISIGPIGGLYGYFVGSTFAMGMLSASHLLALTPYPLLEYRQIGKTEPAISLSFLQRYKWAGDLVNAPRGVDWTHQVVNVPPFVGPRNRAAFLRITAWRCLRGTIYWTLIMAIPRSFGLRSEILIRPLDSALRIALRRSVITAFGALNGCLLLSTLYRFSALILVGVGASQPESWPELFGRWGDAYTLRRFWGRAWHQILRKSVSKWGDFVAQDILQLPRGSNASAYTKLYVAFAVSALMHTGGDYTIFRGEKWFSWRVFIAQAVAITFEDGVIALDKFAGFSARWPALARQIGHLWVLGWFWLCVPEWSGPQLERSIIFAS